MDQRRFDSLLRRAVGIPVIALAVFSALLLWEIQSLRTSLGTLDHADRVINADGELIKMSIDMESAVRGYLNTGKEEFLQPYNAAASTIDSKFAALDQLVSENRAQQIQLDAIQSGSDKWRLLAERAVELHRSGKENGEYEPNTWTDNQQLKQLMDSIRAQLEAFTATEMQLRGVSAQRARGLSKLATITCTLLALAGGGLLALFIWRQMRFLGSDFKASLKVAEMDADSLREKAQLLDLAYDTIVVRALDGAIRFWNHGAEEMYGYSKQQATGKTLQELLHTVYPKPLPDIEEKLRQDGRWEGELIRTVQDGTRVTVSSRWVSQRDKNGQACGVMEISSDITERKQREEDLRERELLLRTVAEQTDIGLVILSEERRYLYSNPAHAEALGLNSAEIVGKRVADVMGDLYSQIGPRLDTAFAGKEVEFEFTVPTWPGTSRGNRDRLYAVTYKPLIRPGEGTRVIAVVVDITERKRAENALRISQERFTAIVNMAMDAVLTLDASQHIVQFNAAAERIFCCPAKEAIGQSLARFIPAQCWEEDRERRHDTGSNGAVGGTTLLRRMHSGLRTNYGLRASGEKFPLEATISQLTVAGERQCTVILRDITQRRQAEEELHEKEERFHSMHEHAAVGIVQVRIDDTYLLVNPAMCEMVGYSETELLALTTEWITHPDDRARESALLKSLLIGERASYEIEKRYLHRDGSTIWVSVTSSLVKDIARRPLYRISIVQNITQRKRTEGQLQQAQKMDAIGQLAGGVAHDFNNLLGVILGYSELALAELTEKDPNFARIQEIEKSAKLGAALTKHLLAFSRKETIAIQVVELKEIVAGIEPMLRRLLPEDILIVVHLPQEACPVMVDPSQLKQVLINLAVNAGDAMTKGGTITIDVRTVEVVEEDQKHTSMKPGVWEMLTVSDTGSGMDAETLSHIFEPFFTTKPVGEGTGLGLATVYGIVRQSGGDVSVFSRPGEGSTFKVCLPRSSEAITTKAIVEGKYQGLIGTETVLLVDDSAPVRKLTMEVLRHKGYSVMEAEDGIQAWELSKNYAGVIHLLITDVVMPRMGGTQLAELIMQDRPDIAVIFLSGYAADKYPMPKHAAGRITAIEKPCSVDLLLQAVRRILDESKDHAN
jgi:two-component system cell cycle sensor histidine kinase/response regulator CckA